MFPLNVRGRRRGPWASSLDQTTPPPLTNLDLTPLTQILSLGATPSTNKGRCCCAAMTTVGAIIATLLPVPLLLISPNVGVMQILLAVVLPTTIHVIVGHGIEPKPQRRSHADPAGRGRSIYGRGRSIYGCGRSIYVENKNLLATWHTPGGFFQSFTPQYVTGPEGLLPPGPVGFTTAESSTHGRGRSIYGPSRPIYDLGDGRLAGAAPHHSDALPHLLGHALGRSRSVKPLIRPVPLENSTPPPQFQQKNR
eukprot:1192469-Prorocentrum_minimum.AAC.1